MEKQEFVKYVRKFCKEYGIKCFFYKKEKFKDSDGSFYINKQSKNLFVATGSELWFNTLIHEFCHVLQFVDGDFITNKESESLEIYDSWLLNKCEDKSLVRDSVSVILRVESDCERRSIKLIKEFDLPVDIIQYTKWANIILYSYLYGYKHRFWPKSILAPNYPEWNIVPTNLDREYKYLPRYMENFLTKIHNIWIKQNQN